MPVLGSPGGNLPSVRWLVPAVFRIGSGGRVRLLGRTTSLAEPPRGVGAAAPSSRREGAGEGSGVRYVPKGLQSLSG